MGKREATQELTQVTTIGGDIKLAGVALASASTLRGSTLALSGQLVGDTLYANTTSSFTRLAAGAVDLVLTSGGAGVAPSWKAGLPAGGTTTQVLHGPSSTATWSAVSLTADVSGTLPVANGGTGATTLTADRIMLGAGTSAVVALAAGTATQVLHGGTPPTYSATSLTADVTGTLPVANGGTGLALYAIGDLLAADTTTSLARRAAVASGQVLASSGVGVLPVWTASPLLTGDLTVDGKVSIGIATPSAKLHVQANGSTLPALTGNTHFIVAATTSVGADAFMNIITGTAGVIEMQFGDTASAIQGKIVYSNITDAMSVSVNAAIRIFIDSSGNIGTGTTGPTSRLHVQGSGTTSATFALKVDDSSPSPLLYVRDDGKVSIGIATPSAKLHVQANGSTLPALTGNTHLLVASTVSVSADAFMNLITGTDGLAELQFGDTASATQGKIAYSNLTDSMSVVVNAATRIFIDSSGNVGIGVSTFGTSAAKVLALTNGTEPTSSPTDIVQLFSVDVGGAATASLALRTEEAVVTEAVVSDSTFRIKINGTVYKVLLKV